MWLAGSSTSERWYSVFGSEDGKRKWIKFVDRCSLQIKISHCALLL
jgi:hypothetical protein